MPRSLLLLLLLLVGACATDPIDRMARLYAENWEDQKDLEVQADPAAFARRRQARCDEVRKMLERNEISGADARLFAATILKDSPRLEDIELARDVALAVAEAGDPRGLPLAAEAIDRALKEEGLPQKYGTLYEFNVITRKWELYPVDPRTTDAERVAMGVVDLAEARRRAQVLNRM